MEVGAMGAGGAYQAMSKMEDAAATRRKDDMRAQEASAQAQKQPTATVNTSGQAVGQMINAVA